VDVSAQIRTRDETEVEADAKGGAVVIITAFMIGVGVGIVFATVPILLALDADRRIKKIIREQNYKTLEKYMNKLEGRE